MTNNKLQVIVDEQGLEKTDVSKLVEAFGGPFEEAGEILATYKELEVTDESQTDRMAEAGEKRKLLKKARTTVENKRKELKADIVKQGRAIDSVARYVKEEIQPAEEFLELQEKFIQIKQEAAAAALKAERTEKLLQYTDDISVYNLDTMDEEQFEAALGMVKALHEAEIERAKKAEADRIAEEEAEKKRQAERDAENAKLKKEAEERAEADRIEREAAEAKGQALTAIINKMSEYRNGIETLDEVEDALKKVESFFSSLDDETKADPRVVASVQDTRLQIRTRQDMIKDQIKKSEQEAAEKAEHDALLAPDKEKIIKFCDSIDKLRDIEVPAVKSKEARVIVGEMENFLMTLATKARAKAEKL